MDFITTREELRLHYKAAEDVALKKELHSLDTHARNFLARCPFVVIGTQDGAGNADATPKGDKPGFVAVLDDITLAIPDRPGNNRLDALENLMVNPAVGLIFMIPGMNETLRVNGDARVTVDPELRERLAVNGRPAQSVIVVKVRSVYMHCAKAFMRSELWKPESWQPRGDMPTLGQILHDQAARPQQPGEIDEWLDEAYRQTLW